MVKPHPFGFGQPLLVQAQRHQLQKLPQPTTRDPTTGKPVPMGKAHDINPSVNVSNSPPLSDTADLTGTRDDSHLVSHVGPGFPALAPHLCLPHDQIVTTNGF